MYISVSVPFSSEAGCGGKGCDGPGNAYNFKMPPEKPKQHPIWSALPFFGISRPEPGTERRALKLLVLIGGGVVLLTAVAILLLFVLQKRIMQ